MLGDVLKKRISELKTCSENSRSANALWKKLRDIAVEEIIAHNQQIDSDIIVPIYYEILMRNKKYIPITFLKILNNNQERIRVLNRNLFTSNCLHKDGLGNQKGIKVRKIVNVNRKGFRYVFEKSNYDN